VGVSSTNHMNIKIWQLTETDFIENPVWYFPMYEDEVFDEENVLPATLENTSDPNTQFVVAADFKDSTGQTYFGYLYWGDTELSYSQPCMFVQGAPVTFWFGIIQPDKGSVPKVNFPITAVSRPELGLKPITVKIPAYGYLNSKYKASWLNS